MLKIKDNVDLKELEKFGFRVDDWNWAYNHAYEIPLCVKQIKQFNKRKNVHFLDVHIENRIIKLVDVYCSFLIEKEKIPRKYIQDLIDAGLVEKVVEDESICD